MPIIKVKHVVSFSSEDKVFKADNILKAETYRKWKCATPGEKNASIVLQFEKATQIHSIDIGNESSAFVEVLVGRSSDSINDFRVLLAASSFMSPLESRSDKNRNRVRMFGQDKLCQSLKDEKFDCVQVVCTQPFNKSISYGLSFIKFHSPPEPFDDLPLEVEAPKATTKLGAFTLKYDEDFGEENSRKVGMLFESRNSKANNSNITKKEPTTYAGTVLAASSSSPQTSLKRKQSSESLQGTPPSKKESKAMLGREIFGTDDPQPSTSSGVRNTPPLKKADNNSRKDNTGNKKTFSDNSKPSASPSSMIKNGSKNTPPPKKIESKTSAIFKCSTGKNTQKVNASKAVRKPMDRVVFALSGFVNPLRSEIRDKALEMGAQYKGDWDRTCSHLVCAFINTPKYLQVHKDRGRIVSKEWILDSYKKKAQLPWKRYMLGTYNADSSEESEEEIVINEKKRKDDKLNGSKLNANGSPAPKPSATITRPPEPKTPLIFSDSETEDEVAKDDYAADTDVDSESGFDTDEEILKLEKKTQALNKQTSDMGDDITDIDDDDDISILPSSPLPNTKDMPLPEIPNIFKKKHFYLYGEFDTHKYHDLQRFITAYNGVLEDYMGENVKYVVTEEKWDKNFDDALGENEDLIFVKPDWVYKCNQAQKLIPYQPYIVIPDS